MKKFNLKDYKTGLEVYQELRNYFNFYNHKISHQVLNYQNPYKVYQNKRYKMNCQTHKRST